MLTYLARAACNGKRPGHLSSLRNYPRTALVTKLMGERDVARFIVAPSGYGKTSVALEYAEAVFGFHHVFWLSGKSPYFIRDLDKGFVSSELMRLDKDPFLVVIDDVPLLDASRAEILSQQVDELLGAGKEVLITCEPTYDAFSRMTDRVLLSARDLLVGAGELAQTGYASKPAADAQASVPARQDRVAGLVWADDGARAKFLCAAVDEELPSEMVLAMFVLMALSSGDIEDAREFVSLDSELLQLLSTSYPHLGIDMLEGTFCTARFDIEDLVAAFLERLEVLAERSTAVGGDALACQLADALTLRGAHARACDLVRLFVSRPRRSVWLERHTDAPIDACCLREASAVYTKLDVARAGGLVHVGEAVRCALLKSNVACCQAARRCMGDERVGTRLAGALLFAANSQGPAAASARAQVGKLADEARAALDEGLPKEDAAEADDGWCGDGVAGCAGSSWLDLAELQAAANVLLAVDKAPSKGVTSWLSGFAESRVGGQLGPVAYLCAAWLIRLCCTRGDFGKSGALGKLCECVITAAAAHLGDSGSLSLPQALAIAALDAARGQQGVSLPQFDEALVWEAATKSDLLNKQVLAYQRARNKDLEARLGTTGARISSRRPPILTVNLYGGLDVSVGENKIDPEKFSRRRDRVLLALLVLNKGKDMSTDKLRSMLFPDAEFESARKGLDSTWCRLKSAIELPDGTCPYLIRRYKSLSINASLLSSDAIELDEVCRMLLFNQPGQGGWSQLVKRVEDMFAGDILPGDADDPALERVLVDKRNSLVTALVAASLSLVRSGEAQQGLWFAQAALRRDDSREDVYAALMRAQIAALQRTAALRTYFDCRKMLAEGMGIDPSKEIVQLYNGIIETEEDLA